MLDNPKGLIKTDLNQNTNENFYLRAKDKFFKNVSPGSKISVDSGDKNEEVSIDDDEVWLNTFLLWFLVKKDRKSIDMKLMAGMNTSIPISTIAKIL